MLEYILFAIGIFLLIKGAGLLVDGSSSLAKRMRISTLVVGLTIVAFGTSTPELIVNLISALKGSSDIAFGNIIGSNIANILLVLGITAIIFPIKVKRSTIWKEIPFALLAVVILFILSNYFLIEGVKVNSLTRVSGLILLAFFAIFLYYTFDLAKKSRDKIKKEDFVVKKHTKLQIFLLIVSGLVGLYFGGKWVVEGAIFVAQQFGWSEFLISATVIAIGTSLPELATGIAAARRKDPGIAVGNVVGSNIFNILWILGITAVVAPIRIPGFINFDLILIGFITFLLFIFLFLNKKHELKRWQGIVFVLSYIAYIVFIVMRG